MDEVAARLKVRDDLLASVVTKLERRRDTRALAEKIQRIVRLIASLETSERLAPDFPERLIQVVCERITMFAALTGREKPPSRLRPLKIKLEVLASTFRELQREELVGARKKPWWRDQISELWGSSFLRRKDAPPGTVTDAVLSARTPKGRAERLLYEACGAPSESFEDFRRKLARVELKLYV
jgi:hypothetical protein